MAVVQTTQLERLDGKDPSTTFDRVVEIIRRDGGVIINGLLEKEHAGRISAELKPVYEADIPDTSGFFPTTTRRATGLLGVSPACVELATNKLWIDVCNAVLTSTCQPWYGEKRATWTSKPILAGTFGFQIHPGSRQQDLHRDDSDYHLPPGVDSCMMGCLVATTRSTKENGATMIIPRSHLWSLNRAPKGDEAIPAELDVGDALIFSGNVYHGGGANKTKDEIREIVGLFMCKGFLRPEENHTLAVPPEQARKLSPQVQRLLGYGISQPAVGFYKYKDPMQILFGVEDDETVHL
ncbi:uncharacterized protein Z519_10079 [Cladophialophora bantiana CBS 173.52]|uniref:Phytanoyl-CoA dioxygenase n=1 Tax=Cladophialophora bantiana (strain ATCC 10958 / CBS 173.52 / CDC B-1940 / NIH 8579) TaxID=1442370 RepID=A0A0D2EGP5_CLAB1|nr:uncharacterized protein Z519_10079 [Cladophialophora bantiana CBS 173.52]KIW89226.1 hypothetical protein Z519_10079 [Cladophialophora bantiana CBS 173.52]